MRGSENLRGVLMYAGVAIIWAPLQESIRTILRNFHAVVSKNEHPSIRSNLTESVL